MVFTHMVCFGMEIFVPLHQQKKGIYRKGKKEQEEHHTDASRYLLIDNIKDAYGVPYLYQSLCKSLIISGGYF